MKKLIALILLCACVCGLAGCTSKEEKALLQDGPWGSRAIWADTKNQMYLICEKGEGDAYATVTAFMFTLIQWDIMECHLKKGTTSVVFNANGKTVMDATAQMRDGKLCLSNFNVPVGGAIGMSINMELTKYSFDEMLDKLPADITSQLKK